MSQVIVKSGKGRCESRKRSFGKREGFYKTIWPVLILLLSVLDPLTLLAQEDELFRSWNQPITPFRIIGNIYYVGANEIASYLITTSEGHIVLDGGFAETAALILENVEALGFRLEDVKVLINSHAHLDHAGGLAELQRHTGAPLMIMQGDVEDISTGGQNFGDQFVFPSAKVDSVLTPGQQVRLGDVTLTAHLTAGHTKGCTTWAMQVTENDQTYDVVFVGSPNVLPGVSLVNNDQYPNIAGDYRKTFELLRTLNCDVFLGAHGSFFNLTKKIDQLANAETPNPFIDPESFRQFVDRKEQAFRKKLLEQQNGLRN